MKIWTILPLLLLSSLVVSLPVTAAQGETQIPLLDAHLQTGGGMRPGVIGLALPVKMFLPIIMRDYEACTFKPSLLSPEDGDNLTTLAPLFRWDNGNDYHPSATNLLVEVATDPDFKPPYAQSLVWPFPSPGIREFRFFTNLATATTYYWRASFVCGSKQAPYSETWSFTTGSDGVLLPASELISPSDGAVLKQGSGVILWWRPVAGALDYLLAYRSPGQEGIAYRFVYSTQTAFSVNKTYEWWVTARSDYGIGYESEHRLITAIP